MTNEAADWKVFRGTREAGEFSGVPPAPPWRTFRDDDQGAAQKQLERGKNFRSTDDAIAMVNAALYLRRPLLIEGNPGTGKSSLAYAVESFGIDAQIIGRVEAAESKKVTIRSEFGEFVY